MKSLSLGPLMIDIAGLSLTDLDRQRLSHPQVGGLILFARNYQDREQLTALCAEVHALRSPRLLIAIDHEGGRVQRCREGFTRIPPMRKLGDLWENDSEVALASAKALGFVLAAELRACGVDLSFTPVLDLDWGRSGVIGNRSFHSDPHVVTSLAGALIEGLSAAGMKSCGKHFPGHGWVEADSHVAIPVDERELSAIETDMIPFRRLPLDAVMPAHVIYERCDSKSSGFSLYWHSLLRNEIKFNGVVFSDDLSMEGASIAGDIVARATAAWTAGCDVLLVCNAPEAVGDVLTRWQPARDPVRSQRLMDLLPKTTALTWDALLDHPLYAKGQLVAKQLC